METGSDVIVAQVVDDEPKPWGLGATLALSFAVIAVFLAIQVAVTIAFVVVLQVRDHTGADEAVARLGTNGLLLSLSAWATLPFTLGLVALFVRLRKPWSLKDYLALHGVQTRTIIVWCGIIVLYGAAYDVATSMTGRSVAQDMMVELYRTAGSVLLFWLTLAVQAPLFEEVFFRGFMFRGIERSRLGPAGAILLTSLTWSMIHFQYEAPELLFVFGLGIILGIARWKSGSTYLTMALHALVNCVAFLQVQYFVAK